MGAFGGQGLDVPCLNWGRFGFYQKLAFAQVKSRRNRQGCMNRLNVDEAKEIYEDRNKSNKVVTYPGGNEA